MRRLAGTAFLLGICTSLVAGTCIAQSDSGAPEEARLADPGAPAVDADRVCEALEAAAAANELPAHFFTRLIWIESRFDPKAVSRAGAQGVAQFMPATARWRGLENPFNPVEAIEKSARLLRDLRREFGNLGLAAAAYNAGSGRVRDWLAGRRDLPAETRAYVRLATGRSAQDWADAKAVAAEMPAADAVPCREAARLLVDLGPGGAAAKSKPVDPWGVELVGSSSEATALAAYARLQQKHFSLLGGREPRVVPHGRGRGSIGWARVRVGAESRESAERLCASLRAAGAGCEVQRN